MSTEEEFRKVQLDHLVDERFAEIFFLAKEEYEIAAKTPAEENLYDLLEEFKQELRRFCELHQMDAIIRNRQNKQLKL